MVVVNREAQMSEALFEIFILLVLAITVAGQKNLPRRGECGILKKEYYYNKKSLTEIGEFPWMARVLYVNKSEDTYWFRCYGVLISKWFVLLNAKCFDYTEEPDSVLLGDWNEENDEETSDCDGSGRCAPVPKSYDILDTIVHPKYNSEIGYNNIALIILTEPVIYSDFIQPICLPSKDKVQMNYDNQLLEVTGWYLNSSLGEIQAKSFARVVNLHSCELMLEDITPVDKEHYICAFACWNEYIYAPGAVLMDSELIDDEPANYYLIGLNVGGPDACLELKPDVYSRVDRYLDWIYYFTNEDISLIMPK